MAYEHKNLSALAYANGFTLWHYRTEDPVWIVSGPGYFNEAARMLREGDFILIHAAAGRAPCATVVVVTLSGAIVKTAPLTPLPAGPITGHQWRAPEADEPREEGGVCAKCGAFANSEQGLPCTPDSPAWETR